MKAFNPRMLQHLAHRTSAFRPACIELRARASRALSITTTTPAAPFSSHRLLSTQNKSSPARRAPSAQNATQQDGRESVVIPEPRGSTWFSRFIAWAEGKNKEFTERTVRHKREMQEMDEIEDKEERAARVQQAKQRLRRSVSGE
jgi:hypothetical protein